MISSCQGPDRRGGGLGQVDEGSSPAGVHHHDDYDDNDDTYMTPQGHPGLRRAPPKNQPSNKDRQTTHPCTHPYTHAHTQRDPSGPKTMKSKEQKCFKVLPTAFFTGHRRTKNDGQQLVAKKNKKKTMLSSVFG